MRIRRLGQHASALIAASVTLAGCGQVPPPRPLTPPPVAVSPPAMTALSLSLARGPAAASLLSSPDNARTALAAFRISCPSLLVRTDGSGLTTPADWRPICAAAATWPDDDAKAFFARWFETVRVGDGATYATGYYEPEIAGVRTRQPGFAVPVYALPPDLVHARPGEAPPLPAGGPPVGRYDPQGRFVPYYDRAAIENGALAGRGLEIAWAADPIEFYFLQVQGSGRLRAPDGTVLRIGYAGQNGYPYTNIGVTLSDRGVIGSGPGQYAGSMQGVIRYLRDHPAEAPGLMRQNQSWVFFRELTGPNADKGPVGALGVPVTAHGTVAADPLFVPLGAPVWLDTDRPEANGLWIAQDTGGAIKGPNRFDTFWGAGADARQIAGGMSGRGHALLLLPRGTLDRLGR